MKKTLYFAVDHKEEPTILGSFYGTREEADSFFLATLKKSYRGMYSDPDVIETQKEAREVIMSETRQAMEEYNKTHHRIDLDERLNYINAFLMDVVPERIRKLAV